MEIYQNMFLSLFYDKWFRSFVSKESGFPLVYLSSFYGNVKSDKNITYLTKMSTLGINPVHGHIPLCLGHNTQNSKKTNQIKLI